MANDAFVRSLREARVLVAGMLASLESGEIAGDEALNEARIVWTRRHLAELDRVIKQEEGRDA
jgi:hypothetical protein